LARLEQDQQIEVVILDIKMPGLDGIETLKLVKAQRPLVEVVMLTGHSTIDSAIHAIKLGAFDYLVKPIEIKQLASKLDEAAARKRRRDELIREIYATPYLTRREQEQQIAAIRDPALPNSDE
jgi:DNA-binding NtrC family response regulator